MAKTRRKPKRPMSSYLFWLKSVRGKLKSENPRLTVTELAKKAGKIWRSLKDKRVWEKKAAKAWRKYNKRKKSYALRKCKCNRRVQKPRTRISIRVKKYSAAVSKRRNMMDVYEDDEDDEDEKYEDDEEDKDSEKHKQDKDKNTEGEIVPNFNGISVHLA